MCNFYDQEFWNEFHAIDKEVQLKAFKIRMIHCKMKKIV